MEAKGWTLEELSEKLGLSKNTLQQRIQRANIEPIFRGSIYPPDTLDRIREAPVGRPPRVKPEEPDKNKPLKAGQPETGKSLPGNLSQKSTGLLKNPFLSIQ